MNKSDKTIILHNRIAPIYDFLHHLQTAFEDIRHRRDATVVSYIKEDCIVLDLGTGTALTLIRMLKTNHQCVGVGVDLSFRMLIRAKKKTKDLGLQKRIGFVNGDLENLPFGDNSFGAVISVYGVGGVKNITSLMSEIVRISAPEARITIAEMSAPPSKAKLRNILHRYIVEPWIKFMWGFRDLDLPNMFSKMGIEVDVHKYYRDKVFGSTTLISGCIKK